MFWPSFNSAVTAHGDDQHRTAMNTYYSLASCTLATYGMSALTAHDGKLDMVSTAGGRAAGGRPELVFFYYGRGSAVGAGVPQAFLFVVLDQKFSL